MVEIVSAPPYSNEAYALFAKMTTQPTEARKGVIDTLIRALEAADLWNKFDLFYVLGAHDSQAAQLNWVSPGVNTLAAVNSPTFTADNGYAGDGLTSYLESGLALNAAVRYTQNSAHSGGWQSSVITIGKSLIASTTAVTFIRVGVANSLTRINGNVSVTVSVSDLKHVVGVRRDAANHFGYGNGGNEASGVLASVVPTAASITILRDNGGNFSPNPTFAAHIGSQLSAADVLALYTALDNYRVSIGAP